MNTFELSKWLFDNILTPAIVNKSAFIHAPIEMIISVFGSAGLGKTSFSKELESYSYRQGYSAIHLQLDGYLLERQMRKEMKICGYQAAAWRLSELKKDIDSLLCQGSSIMIPEYDHFNGSVTRRKIISPARLIILDGNISLQRIIRKYVSLTIFFYSEPEIQRELRYKIDTVERNYSPERAREVWIDELPFYIKNIEPYKRKADIEVFVDKNRNLDIKLICQKNNNPLKKGLSQWAKKYKRTTR